MSKVRSRVYIYVVHIMYLEIEGDVGDKVHDNEAGCFHSQLVGHVPVVDIHPTPVLHLRGGGTMSQCN